MSQTVTFFYNRDSEISAELATKKWNTEQVASFLDIFSPSRLKESTRALLQKRTREPNTDITALLNNLAENTEGWVAVRRHEKGQDSKLKVEFPKNSSPPGEVLELRPGYPARFRPAAPDLRFTRGAHFIIPVNEDALGRLKELRHQLSWFSPDLAALVFDRIAQPSLETRMDRVERKLELASAPIRQRADGFLGAASRSLRAAWRFFRSQIQFLTLGLLVFLTVKSLAPGNPASGSGEKDDVDETRNETSLTDPSQTETDSRDDGAAEESSRFRKSVTSPADGQGVDEPKHVAQTREILERVLGSRQDGAIGRLFGTHLSRIPAVREASEWEMERIENLWENNYFLWSVIKLAIVRTAQPPAAADFLANEREWSKTKQVLRESKFKGQSRALRRALGFAACQIQYTTREGNPISYKRPGIRPTVRGTNAEYLFLAGKACPELSFQDTEEGLEEILRWLRAEE